MHELTLLLNIAIALTVAFSGGLVARRIGLPTIFGYLLAGIIIGPFTPGFVGDVDTISQLAELGVIFLMFGVGLHFSFADLWRVRDIAIPGALIQSTLTTLSGFALSQLWGWPPSAGIVFGLAISVASTVVLLRGLMDNSLLNTPHGQAAVGWLVLEDIVSVLILVLMPALAPSDGQFVWQNLGLTLLKSAAFIALVVFVGVRLIPALLKLIAHTQSRELFVLAVLTISLGTAFGSSALFGVSLALGAFVAGAVVSESPLSHQVGADILPFRDTFAALFFVSIGMLVNPAYLFANLGAVLAVTMLVVIGKFVVTTLLGLLFPRPARTMLVIAAGLSQIGEFSFILGQGGVALGLLTQNQYSLILAGSLLSIMINPLMFKQVGRIEGWIKRFPPLWRRMDRHGPPPPMPQEIVNNHVVVVGYGRVGTHIVNVLEKLQIPRLVIESSLERVEELNKCGTPTLYGEAANSEVLSHAGLARARALVVTLPDGPTSELIVAAAHDMAPQLPIIARAPTQENIQPLTELGAQVVIQPELEGGLQLVRHLLLQLGFPLGEVRKYADAVRRDHYNLQINTTEEQQVLSDLLSAAGTIDITWLRLPEDSPLNGQTLLEANLRARTGASIVAIMRHRQLIPNPKSLTVFQAGDQIGLIGNTEQVEATRTLIGALHSITVAQVAATERPAQQPLQEARS